MDNDINESVKIEATEAQKKTENITVEVSEIFDGKTHFLHNLKKRNNFLFILTIFVIIHCTFNYYHHLFINMCEI